MTTAQAVIVGDAHLGYAPDHVAAQLHDFLAAVPRMGSRLIVSGDLFEFWFAYRRVVPRAAFPILHALASVRDAGVRLTVVGGNHDRWGGDFWEREIGAEYHAREARLDVAGLRTAVLHGDGLADATTTSRVLHRIVHHPWTARAFRWVHPDIGLGFVERLAHRLPGKDETDEPFAASAAAQAAYARRRLAAESPVDVLVMGHTHRSVIERIGEQRWYVNPGAWMDGYRYAVLGADGPELRQWTGGGRQMTD